MDDRLSEYRRRRDAARTPEPVPPVDAPETRDPAVQGGPGAQGHPDAQDDPTAQGHPDAQGGPGASGARFVVQQHHATRLHWDLRLERDGVLVSWAVPRGIPREPGRNHLAVHTEDHPLEYLEFAGEIPAGEYGGGRMLIHDRGEYGTEKWRDDEVIVELRGGRVTGRYVLFQTRGRDWIIRRLDPPPAGWTPMPELIAPQWPVPGRRLPADDAAWGYELRWPGTRVVGYVSGGRVRLLGGDGREVTDSYPELAGVGEALAPVECVLDGVVVALEADGRIAPDAVEARAAVTDRASARRLAARVPARDLAFDLLWLEGRETLALRYDQRRELLDGLGVEGALCHTPPYFPGGGRFALDTAREQGLPGIVGKRLASPYRPGRRTRDWLTIPAADRVE